MKTPRRYPIRRAQMAQLAAVLDEFKVPGLEKDELLQLLAPMKGDIVTK